MFDRNKDKKASHTRVNEPGLMQQSAATSPSLQTAAKAAVIGPGIVITGDITGSENLLIEGKVKGHIHLSAHEVTIGQSGEVTADVVAKVIRVAGKINGDLAAKEKVIINSSGNVRGNIVAPRMSLEDGAIFKGSIDMDPGEPASSQAAPPARPAIKPGGGPELVPDAAKKNADLALKSG
jgi:cytoskeletal protein CcmA (bactofilin family)